MKCIVVAVLLTVAQAAQPVPRKAPDSSAGTSSHVQKNASAQKNQTTQSPPSLQPQKSAENENAASGQGKENTQQAVRVTELPAVTVSSPRRDWADWGMWAFNLLLALTSGLQVWLLCRTLKLARLQTHEMKRQRIFMGGQLKAMQAQLVQMVGSGEQTNQLIEEAKRQTKELTDATTIALAHSKAAASSADAANASTNAFVHSQRPWLTLETSVAGPLTFDEQGAHITLGITLQNIGHMPAQGVWIHPVLSLKSDQNAERKRICEELSPKLSGLGPVVFPGQTRVQNWGIRAGSVEIETRCREIFPNLDEPPFVPFSVIVAVQYTAGIDPNAILYTAALYDLRRIDSNENGTFPLLIKRGENVQASSLYLQLSALAGIIAK